jgi:hypothetical protein
MPTVGKPIFAAYWTPKVAEPTQPKHGDDIARPCAAVAQRVERGDAGAHQWGRIDGREVRRHQGDRARGCDHVFAVPAVIRDARGLAAHAGEKRTAAAVVAIPAIAAVPPDADAPSRLPSGHAGADRVDHPGHLMAGNPRVLNSWEKAFFRHRIAVADAACFHLKPHGSRARLWYWPFNDLKGPIRARDLYNTHGRHSSFCCLPSAPAVSKSCSLLRQTPGMSRALLRVGSMPLLDDALAQGEIKGEPE